MNTPGRQPAAQQAPEQDEYIEEIDVQEAGVSGGASEPPTPPPPPPPSPPGGN